MMMMKSALAVNAHSRREQCLRADLSTLKNSRHSCRTAKLVDSSKPGGDLVPTDGH
jgi:hypothetical protein